MLPHTVLLKAVDVSDGLPLAVFRVFSSVTFLVLEVNISRVTVPMAKRVRARWTCPNMLVTYTCYNIITYRCCRQPKSPSWVFIFTFWITHAFYLDQTPNGSEMGTERLYDEWATQQPLIFLNRYISKILYGVVVLTSGSSSSQLE